MTQLLKALSVLVIFSSTALVSAQEPRYLDPAEDVANLPANDGILFWRGDEQIAGFRNIPLLSETRRIEAADSPMELRENPQDFSRFEYQVDGTTHSLDDYLRHNHVAGLLVLKDGEIVLERHGLGNSPDDVWVSFSQTKSVVSMLIGAAIRDGYIESVDDPVTDYLPRLRGTAYDPVSIRDVLQMASGVDWNEDYADPTSDVATSPNDMLELMQFMGAKDQVAEPGTRFNYNTGETNLAGAILRAAIGNNLSTYLTHKIWQPWGMADTAYWITHGPGGGELGGCCINATLRDWGRLALFILNDGVLHDGTAVLPDDWMVQSTTPSPASDGYGYLWWLEGDGTYRASGIFGQGIYFNPENNLAIVVQGGWPQATGSEFGAHRDAFFSAVDNMLE